MEAIDRWTADDACRLQSALRLSHEGFAERIGVAPRTVAAWHQRGRTVPQYETQRALDILLEHAAPGVRRRFDGRQPPPPSSGHRLRIRSHKFVTAYPGDRAACLAAGGDNWPDLLGGHHVRPVSHPGGESDLHVWPHGAAVAHVIEEPVVSSLAELAAWRYGSYPADLAWLGDTLAGLGAPGVGGEYVLSAYWISAEEVAGDVLDRAVRVVCMPRVLCGDQAGAPADVEARLLADGFDHPDLVPFGIPGAGIGYASWSGVAYAPLDPARALTEQAVVDLELPLQSVWAHCSRIIGQVEQGADPDVPAAFGWRWLRAARSRLLTPRPQEPNPHRTMREAIVATSGFPALVGDAMTAIREVERA